MDWKSIYNSWKPGTSWQSFWTKKRQAPEPKSLPEMPELPEAPVTAAPAVNVVDLQNSVVALKKERDDLKAALDRKTFLFDALERSLGVAAAKQIVDVPNFGGELQSPIDKFNSMPEGPEKTAFYQRHQNELLPFINKPKA